MPLFFLLADMFLPPMCIHVDKSTGFMQAAAAATYYLPAYDFRQVTGSLAHIRQALDDLQSQLPGKRKFSFRRKPSRTGKAAAGGDGPATAGMPQRQPDSAEARSTSDAPVEQVHRGGQGPGDAQVAPDLAPGR